MGGGSGLYDTGHTVEEIYEQFNVGYKLIRSAKKAKLFKTRSKADQQILAKSKLKALKCFDPKRTQELVDRYQEGNSLRDLYKIGFTYTEYQKALRSGLLVLRSKEDEHKLKIAKHGSPSMGEAARKRLSERQALSNTGGRCKWYTVGGISVQGTWEFNVATKLSEHGIAWVKAKSSDYLWWYVGDDGKEHSYAPDFYLPELNTWLEIKGYWWGNDKRKMEIVSQTYPDRRLVIIEKVDYERILQGEQVWSLC